MEIKRIELDQSQRKDTEKELELQRGLCRSNLHIKFKKFVRIMSNTSAPKGKRSQAASLLCSQLNNENVRKVFSKP